MLSEGGVNAQPLEVNDFSGGMTDDFISAAQNKTEKADNFFIGFDKRLVTRPGLTPANLVNPRIPTELKIQTLFDAENQLFQLSDGKIYYENSGFTHVQGPTANKALILGDTSTFTSWTPWNKHVILSDSKYSPVMRLFKDGATWKTHQLGLPALASTPTITGTGSTFNYLYAFHYKVTYTSSGNTFEELGPVTYSTVVTNSAAPNTTPINITAIPVLANGLTKNFDTVNIKTVIFRTANNGDVFYKLGEVTNGNTIFFDNFSDVSIALPANQIYTTGDVPDHEAPPPAKHIHQVNDVLILGAVKEGGIEFPNRARFSNRFELWSCPAEFFEDFDEPIMGISSLNIYPIVFCENKIYRIEGYYLPDGSGRINKIQISDTAGLLSENSIVKTDNGLYFAGKNGFYYTDGNQVTRLSGEINVTYSNYTKTSQQSNRIYGAYDKVMQQVLWAMSSSDVGDDNDTVFVGHMRFGQGNLPLTTWSGGPILSSNFAPTSIYSYKNEIYQGDKRGYLLRYNDEAFSDKKIDTLLSPSLWLETVIIYDYQSPAFDFGSSSYRKWVPWIIFAADNSSSVSIQPSLNIDNSGYFIETSEIKVKGDLEWGDPDIAWEDENIRWNYAPLISAKRRVPAGAARGTYFQLRLTNAYTVIETSELYSAATVSVASKTVTLDMAGLIWPDNVIDYYYSSAEDNYDKQFRIIARTDTTLTVDDVFNGLVAGSYAWQIEGYRRNEIVKILSYALDYSLISQSQSTLNEGA